MTEGMPDVPPAGGSEEKPEGWTWTLFTGVHESAVEVWRDGELKLTLPITSDQAELLMGRPVTLAGELRRDGLLTATQERRPSTETGLIGDDEDDCDAEGSDQ